MERTVERSVTRTHVSVKERNIKSDAPIRSTDATFAKTSRSISTSQMCVLNSVSVVVERALERSGLLMSLRELFDDRPGSQFSVHFISGDSTQIIYRFFECYKSFKYRVLISAKTSGCMRNDSILHCSLRIRRELCARSNSFKVHSVEISHKTFVRNGKDPNLHLINFASRVR